MKCVQLKQPKLEIDAGWGYWETYGMEVEDEFDVQQFSGHDEQEEGLDGREKCV